MMSENNKTACRSLKLIHPSLISPTVNRVDVHVSHSGNRLKETDRTPYTRGCRWKRGCRQKYMIGCLVTSSLDDGRGVARSKIVKHRHELVTGKTSTIQTYILGLDENDEGVGILPENEMVLKSHRLVSLMDLAGVRVGCDSWL